MDWIIMGLGNPGAQYHSTRHNAGFWVLERLAEQAKVQFRKPFFSSFEWAKIPFEGGNLILIKPLTFMNLSGQVLSSISGKFSLSLDNFLVVVDQMDLPVGQIRAKSAGSSAGHNGLKSLEEYAQTQEYKRLYVGIGRPRNGKILDWVLGIPEENEAAVFSTVVDRICGILPNLVKDDWEKMVYEFNRSPR